MKNITITDRNGQQFIVEEQDLFDQLANLNLPGSKGAKTVAKNIAAAGAKMREAQKRYFQTRDATDLRIAKNTEATFDEILRHFNRTIELV